jgi:hypothetical protein
MSKSCNTSCGHKSQTRSTQDQRSTAAVTMMTLELPALRVLVVWLPCLLSDIMHSRALTVVPMYGSSLKYSWETFWVPYRGCSLSRHQFDWLCGWLSRAISRHGLSPLYHKVFTFRAYGLTSLQALILSGVVIVSSALYTSLALPASSRICPSLSSSTIAATHFKPFHAFIPNASERVLYHTLRLSGVFWWRRVSSSCSLPCCGLSPITS